MWVFWGVVRKKERSGGRGGRRAARKRPTQLLSRRLGNASSIAAHKTNQQDQMYRDAVACEDVSQLGEATPDSREKRKEGRGQ
jgi:hypothetical protein